MQVEIAEVLSAQKQEDTAVEATEIRVLVVVRLEMGHQIQEVAVEVVELTVPQTLMVEQEDLV